MMLMTCSVFLNFKVNLLDTTSSDVYFKKIEIEVLIKIDHENHIKLLVSI